MSPASAFHPLVYGSISLIVLSFPLTLLCDLSRRAFVDTTATAGFFSVDLL